MTIKQIISRRKARQRKSRVIARKSTRQTRLLVNRSNKAIYAQLIDNLTGKTIGTVSSLKSGKNNVAEASRVGEEIANIAKKNKITEAVFDRNHYKFHGRIKALAESANKAGLTI
jgi:large subunit ribosomal protein L18